MAVVPKPRGVVFTSIRLGYIVDQCFARVPGGTARYTAQLGAALARTAAPRDSVEGFAGMHPDITPGIIDGVTGPARMGLPTQALARAWATGTGPAPRGVDIVHAPTPLLPPARRRPLVVTIHDAVPWTHPETLTAHGARWHQRMGGRAAKADLVIAPTAAVAAALAEVIAPRRIEVVGEGSTDSVTSPPPDAAQRRKRLGLPPRYALVLGTAEPRKGLDVALDAWAGSAAPDLPLVVVGPTGWGGIELTAERDSRGIASSRVVLLGHLDDADLASVLAAATLLVAPSRAEGFGLPVLESMAAGVPVVLSADPAQVEVAGGAGVVVPIGDPAALAAQVRSLAGDPGRRALLTASGLDRAATQTWDAAAQRMWALYRELLAQ